MQSHPARRAERWLLEEVCRIQNKIYQIRGLTSKETLLLFPSAGSRQWSSGSFMRRELDVATSSKWIVGLQLGEKRGRSAGTHRDISVPARPTQRAHRVAKRAGSHCLHGADPNGVRDCPNCIVVSWIDATGPSPDVTFRPSPTPATIRARDDSKWKCMLCECTTEARCLGADDLQQRWVCKTAVLEYG